ncbi:MAG: prolyl oligopeptidase family serine peptidase, partial [Acidobacteriaceae bacterium]|nr:prolyl oligopeptidase family serine peptidase [Acidobacteriaceae bacterium]
LGRILRLTYEKAAKPVPLELPFEGYLTPEPSGLEPNEAGGVSFQLTGWTHPAEYFHYDPAKHKTSHLMALPRYPVDLSEFVSEEVSVPSADGVLVPLTIVHRRDVKNDGSHFTVLAGYGAYGAKTIPSFLDFLPWNPIPVAWLEEGGIYAYAHVRGGGELGEAWHQAGMNVHKINSISDFIACAEFLIHERYTSPEHLAIEGGSAGGTLVAGAITKRPGLFRAMASFVGVHDLLRLELTPIGPGQITEFGTVKNKDEFSAMYSLSPYHQVKAGVKYPAAIFYMGANDVRVPQWEVTKMVARLQANTASGRPVLLHVNYDAGHAAGLGMDQLADTYSQAYAFFLWQMGDPGFQPQ